MCEPIKYNLKTISAPDGQSHTHTHTHTSRCVVSDVCAGAGVRHVPIVSECKCMSGCYRLPHYQEVAVYRASLSDEQEEQEEGEREGEGEGEEEREGEKEGEGEGKEGESEGEREEGEREGEEETEEEGEGEEGSGRAVGQGELDSHEIIDIGRCAGSCPQPEQQCIP